MALLQLGLLASALAASSPPSLDRTEDLLFIDNGVLKVGIDRRKGASITHVSGAACPQNTVNSADPGRLIQQSYYAGKPLDRTAAGQHPAWSPWTWNPIQGGGVGSWAQVTAFEKPNTETLYAETLPKLWDMPDEEAAATMRQWTAFEPNMPNVAVVRCELVCGREPDDPWGPAVKHHQELPALYFTRHFSSMQSYLGGGAWRQESTPLGPPWGRTDPPKKAMACFNADGLGIAVFSPAATVPWNFGPHGPGLSDDPAAGPCVHIAPLDAAALGPNSIYRYRYWLILGTADEIAARLDALWEQYANERSVLDEPAD